ncbi:MAG: hypothetical protein AAGI11_22700 [Pseudomonadota bacterium]
MRWLDMPVRLLIALLIAGGSQVIRAAEAPKYSAEIGVGGEYDSNVTVDEVDITSSQSDYALTLDGELRASQQFTDRTGGSLTYDFSQTNYQEFSLVNRQTHLLGADLDHKIKGVRAGLSLYYIHSRLDSDPFLTLYRTSPSLSGFINKKLFARAAYVYADKRIDQSSDRDAITDSLELDIYYFQRGLRSYFNIGYKYKDEDSRAARLDYSSDNVKVRYVRRFDWFDRTHKFEISWRYEYRDYSAIEPAIGEEREDKRNRWRFTYEVPLGPRSALQLYGGYGEYDSNFQAADYYQTVMGSRFIYRWD